ncbi:MAG: ABC transporter permease [Phycisphaerales bacterium]|nr:ABC transporter permease [Phycisphaerae bacterium]NNF42176.1 ABC transporter permease [Phycisphaerales bacterium]NNM27579.1 ABC transporter permease [Phycisphaerales bacterium]
MNGLRALYRRLDALQRRRSFKLAATALALLVCGLTWGRLILTTVDLDGQRRALVTAMTGQNLNDEDEHAVSLAKTGLVTVNGRTYGGERFAARPDLLFAADGSIDAVDGLANAMLRDQYPGWAPRWLLEQPGTTWMLALVTTGWLLLIIWMNATLPFTLTLAATAAFVGAAALAGSRRWMWAFGGMGLLTFTFLLLIRVMLLLLERPNQTLAIAHTVIKEASRTKIALVFIILILVLLPLLPLGLDPESPLRYQIQTFISRSLGFTFYLAACMTLFLSCATVAFEIRDRQIWQLLTKPVSRFNYLLGKWLGVITVNMVIMLIAAVSIFTYIQFLREQPVASGMQGFQDAQQVQDVVLTARVGRQPAYERPTIEQLRGGVEATIDRTPELSILDEVPLSVRRKLEQDFMESWFVGQRSVPPGAMREYIFRDLGAAKELQSSLTLRYRFHIMRDDEHETFPAVFVFNNNPDLSVRRTYVPTVSHVVSIPSEFIRDDGTLSITVVNLFEPPSQRRGAGALNFEADDFELLYKVGSFEGNFARAIVVDWIKLAFLAMLGICCATFLSFPVACLTSFTIFVAGTIGPFLATSLDQYYPPSLEAVDWGNVGMVIQWAFKSTIRGIAQAIVFLLDSFGKYRPTQSLVEGRLIPWGAVIGGGLKVGVIWSGLSLIVGYLVLRHRQLAIYSGHG